MILKFLWNATQFTWLERKRSYAKIFCSQNIHSDCFNRAMFRKVVTFESIRISVATSAIQIKVCLGFPHYLQANVGIVS
jgi:hypothetical protein